MEELKKRVEEQQLEIRKLNQELNLIGGGDGPQGDDFEEDEAEGDGDSVEARRRKLFMALKAKVWGRGWGRRGEEVWEVGGTRAVVALIMTCCQPC